MCETLGDHEGSVSIGGRLIISFRFADDIVVNAEEEEEARILVDRYNHKVQNRDWSRQGESDYKQHKLLPKRDQENRSEARSSAKIRVSWSNHL